MRRLFKLTAVTGLLLWLLPTAAPAQIGSVFLELDSVLREGIPANCSTWHELYPSFCLSHHQNGYEDNGDGLLSPCDFIYLDDGDRLHVDWVGPTYYLNCDIIAEPLGDYIPGSPVCQEWIEIHPNHGLIRHVTDWQDNGDGVVSACDIVFFSDGLACHIMDVRTNIRVTPDGSAAEESTWSKVKGLFKNIF